MQKIALFGLGAIGSVMASCVSARGAIAYYNRSERKVIEVEHAGRMFRRQMVLSDAEASAVPDWLIVCLKAYHYPGALADLCKLITPDTKIALIGNGLRLTTRLLPFADEANMLECMIDCPTQIAEAGHYVQLRHPVLTVPTGALAEVFATLISPQRIEVRRTEDFLTENWRKLVESSSLGGLMVLYDQDISLFQKTEMKALYAQALAEGIAVARADGADLRPAYQTEMLEKLASYPSTKSSSMLLDRRRGNPIEIEAKSAVISRLGKAYGVATPVHDRITDWCETVR